tara:strand:+ start:1704 stop:2006 length:303 start_codon:yes stop_codon:yes gene_type:complete
MRDNVQCPDPDHDDYPHYGVAPHECYYKKGPQALPGQSTLKPREEWPDNFVLEVDPGEDGEAVAYPDACGVFFCPTCRKGQDAFQARMDARARSEETDRA